VVLVKLSTRKQFFMKIFYPVRFSYASMLVALFCLNACKKNDLPVVKMDSASPLKAVCFDCDYLEEIYKDSLDHPTILGEDIRNPYLPDNIAQAYKNVYGQLPSKALTVTHLYVKFSPSNYNQLDQLEEMDVELFDYPLHKKLRTEGDYYLQAGKQLEDIPEYYAVVDPAFKFSNEIKYTIIERMHIPDSDPKLENEALRLSGDLADGDEYITTSSLATDQTLKILPPEPGGNQELPILKSCKNYPSGRIVVQNALMNDHSFSPVQDVRVVVRRSFKTETIYTNQQGEFECKKYFRNKYTVTVSFKNRLARIARMRPHAIHEQFFPLKINFGKWDNLDCRHEFLINHPKLSGTIATSHWCAAVTHNGIIEHRKMSQGENVGLPPLDLNIMLSSKKGSGSGNTYMLNKILKTNEMVPVTQSLLTAVTAIWSPIASGLFFLANEAYKQRAPDIKFGYGGDPEFLTTNRYCELVYHELSHASHYNQVGNNWWLKLGIAENKNPGEGTYGECCTDYAPCIALAEGWAYFFGHYLADKKWKNYSTPFPEQGNLTEMINLIYFSNQNNLSSHIHFLESYDPHRQLDPNKWIPKGLLYDLIDPAHESFPQSNQIDDQVFGYSTKQIFDAMQPNIGSIDEFMHKLIQLDNNRQHAQTISLFKQYGY
jgi:hypothetical protein